MTDVLVEKCIELLILILVTIVTSYVIPFIKARISADKLEVIKDYATIFVHGIEQKYYNESSYGKVKKEEVVKLLTEKAGELGLNLSSADIDLIIENAVLTLKKCWEESEVK